MTTFAESFEVHTKGRSIVDLTAEVRARVKKAGAERGLCNVFLHHTSASLILCENADPQVQRDLEAFASRLVPDGDRLFEHVAEGPDDMPAHVRAVLTGNSISLPVAGGTLDVGTWQGVYLWEHRHAPHRRRVTVTVVA